MRQIAWAVGVLALAGCASAPTHFFVLDPTPPAQPSVQSSAPVPPTPIQLTSVHIPPDLDRPEVVVQVAANRLKLSDQDHWAAPLGEMIRRVLSQDLDSRLPAGLVVAPDAPAPVSTRAVVVDILEFRSTGGQVDLQANWTLLAAGSGRPVLSREVRLTADSGAGGADAQAAAMSRLLGEFATGMASTLMSGQV